MKNYRYFTILLTVLCISCTKTNPLNEVARATETLDQTVVPYFIKKGNHYCDQTRPLAMAGDEIAATVRFDSTAAYTSTDINNQRDVNKLIGFSDCGSHHHENSARLGWSWNGKEIVMYAYAYVDKKRIIKPLGAVRLNETFSCSVSASGSSYRFTVNENSDSIRRHCPDYSGERYKLFPYFGGDESAPHDITVTIAEQPLKLQS